MLLHRELGAFWRVLREALDTCIQNAANPFQERDPCVPEMLLRGLRPAVFEHRRQLRPGNGTEKTAWLCLRSALSLIHISFPSFQLSIFYSEAWRGRAPGPPSRW